MKKKHFNILHLGATGAVGTQAAQTLLQMPAVHQLTLLGRRPHPTLSDEKITQQNINIFEPASYEKYLAGHQAAICTLGVGQPSKVSKADFLKIDKQAVLDFATACKAAGVQHFSLLSSVGIDASSSTFYLRAKGELVEEIKALNFDRFSVFQPSMILTPENRYGLLQGITLTVWPLLNRLLIGKMKKYRGIPVEILGQAMAKNVLLSKRDIEYLLWDDFYRIVEG